MTESLLQGRVAVTDPIMKLLQHTASQRKSLSYRHNIYWALQITLFMNKGFWEVHKSVD